METQNTQKTEILSMKESGKTIVEIADRLNMFYDDVWQTVFQANQEAQ